MASITVGKLYKRGDIWYFRYTDHDGRRSQRSTGKTVKREATIFAQSFIDAHHITDGTLLIDQQASPHHDHPVPPKWGVIRAIPLPRIALGALSSVTPDSQGRYFSALTQRDVTDLVRLLKAALCAADPENRATWSALTLHTLRHSANTNLLVAGCSPVLVAEYLAWKHQELVDMQRNYTHMVAMNLKPVADMMDILCTPKAKMGGSKTIVFQGNG